MSVKQEPEQIYGQQYRQGDLLFIHVKSMPSLKLVGGQPQRLGPNSAGLASSDTRQAEPGQVMHPLLTPKGDTVVLEGEVTGHQHKLRGGQLLLLVSDSKQSEAIEIKSRHRFAQWSTADIGAALARGAMGYAVLEAATVLEHPEHKPIELPPGIYEIRRQQVFQQETFGESERPQFVED